VIAAHHNFFCRPYHWAMNFGRWLFAAFCVTASLATPSCSIAAVSPVAILIVDESDSNSPFIHRFRQQVHSTLDAQSKKSYIFYPESLDFGHFSGAGYEATLRAFFKNKYKDEPIGIIVAFGSKALKFMSSVRAELWPSAPIVFVTFYDTRDAFPSNATGAVASRRFENLVASARHLVPNLAQIVLVGDKFDQQPLRRQYKVEVQQWTKTLNVLDLTGLPIEDVKKRIAALPSDAAIAYTPVYSDETGQSHNPGEVLELLAGVADRPIVVDSETLIGKGAAGGIVLSAEGLGRDVGRRIAQLLDGEAATNIPTVFGSFTEPIFDARQLKRWDISEQSLPSGSDVRFRELNVWDLYRWQIVAIAIIIPLQALVILLLFYEHRRRQSAEQDAHQRLLQVTQMDRAMTASAMSASIAHELNQPLSAILNNAETAEILLTASPPDLNLLKEILNDIRRDDHRAVDIIKHMRKLLRRDDFTVEDIELNDFVSETVDLFKRWAAEHDVVLEIVPIPADYRVRADRVHIQQVLLNLVMNAIDAMQNIPKANRKLKLFTSRRGREVVIEIEDTGMGIPEENLKNIFDPFITTKQQGTGLGLSIARTIIGIYGGTIWAENRTPSGAKFCFTLTLIETEPAQMAV
jgi:signal transduction histidine kinase